MPHLYSFSSDRSRSAQHSKLFRLLVTERNGIFRRCSVPFRVLVTTAFFGNGSEAEKGSISKRAKKFSIQRFIDYAKDGQLQVKQVSEYLQLAAHECSHAD